MVIAVNYPIYYSEHLRLHMSWWSKCWWPSEGQQARPLSQCVTNQPADGHLTSNLPSNQPTNQLFGKWSHDVSTTKKRDPELITIANDIPWYTHAPESDRIGSTEALPGCIPSLLYSWSNLAAGRLSPIAQSSHPGQSAGIMHDILGRLFHKQQYSHVKTCGFGMFWA